jgi:phosphoserine phosphatase
MLNLAGLGIAFHAKPTVKKVKFNFYLGLDGVLYFWDTMTAYRYGV